MKYVSLNAVQTEEKIRSYVKDLVINQIVQQ